MGTSSTNGVRLLDKRAIARADAANQTIREGVTGQETRDEILAPKGSLISDGPPIGGRHLYRDWIELVSFRPPKAIQTRARNLPDGAAYIQRIEDAKGRIVNLDFFSVLVTELPRFNGSRVSPEEVLTHIRLYINSFIDTQKAEFSPYVAKGHPTWTNSNESRWRSDSPVGALLNIDIPMDNGSVITADATGSRWRFMTMRTRKDGVHPVSGTREFGFVSAKKFTREAQEFLTSGGYAFYTRGVDRPTRPDFSGGYGFSVQEALWRSFQKGIMNYVNGFDGTAFPISTTIHRVDWSDVKVQLHRPKKEWSYPAP